MIFYRLDRDSNPDVRSYVIIESEGLFDTEQELIDWLENRPLSYEETEYLERRIIQTDRGWCVRVDGLFGLPADNYDYSDVEYFLSYIRFGETVQPVNYLQIWEGDFIEQPSYVDGVVFKPIKLLKVIPLKDIKSIINSIIYKTVDNTQELVSAMMTLFEELTDGDADAIIAREKKIYNINNASFKSFLLGV